MTNDELFAEVALKTWKFVTSRLDQMLSNLSDEEFQTEIAPGRNRVYYIVGHLAAHHDRLIPMLGFGERLHPELDDLFIENPDRTFPDEIAASSLREALKDINFSLSSSAESLTAGDWLERHTSVSQEDFAKDPTRNRIALFEQRTAHAAFHTGQIRLVCKP